jgi:hypothetical protein
VSWKDGGDWFDRDIICMTSDLTCSINLNSILSIWRLLKPLAYTSTKDCHDIIFIEKLKSE